MVKGDTDAFQGARIHPQVTILEENTFKKSLAPNCLLPTTKWVGWYFTRRNQRW